MKIARFLLIALACVLAASQVLTDRIGFLQWVWWIPRVFLAMPLVLGGIAVWIWSRGDDRRRNAWLAAAAVALALFATRGDWGLPKSRPEGSVRVVFWNVCSAGRDEADAASAFLQSTDADVIVLTDPGLALAGQAADWCAEGGYTIARPGRFAIVTRLPLIEAVPLYAARERALARLAVEAAGRRLVIDAFDLPSETTMHRYASVRAFVGTIEGLRPTPAGLSVGDFNITRGSASLDLLVPGATEAFASAGVGWGGTYPRTRPLLAIDQVLVGDGWVAERAEVRDPRVGRHRALVVDLLPTVNE